MNQPNIEKLVNKLRYNVKPRRRLRQPDGPEGRLLKLRKTLTALIKFERLELNYPRGDETRGYVDQLIFQAIRHGPMHKETMDLANFWIIEKQLVHKLFKVLVPRYQNYTTSFTKLHKAPNIYPIGHFNRAILELRGNVYPSLEQYNPHERNLLHNLLLDAAKKEYRMEKYKEMADNIKQ